jgi:4-amino-4-deoxy-L-arabinose transferase-like glycosyltransferase
MEIFKELNLKITLFLAALLSAGVFLSRLYEPSLSGDAVKYALVAKTMLKTGNYLIPHLGDEPYFKKPPLFFWIIAASFKLFGLNEFAARLPSAVFGVLDATLLAYIAYRITQKAKLALLTALIFTLNFEVIRITTIVRLDSFLLFLNLLTLLLLLKPGMFNALAAGFLSGAGVLAKGPFGIIAIISSLIYFFVKRDRRLVNAALALVIALLPGVLYISLVGKSHPELTKELINNQILGRITGELKEGTPRAFYFYERIILKHFWPWNLFLIAGIWKLLKDRSFLIKEVKDKELFWAVLVFFLTVFLPLHFISLKFTRYSYYLYPFLALITALAVASLKLENKILKASILLTAVFVAVAAVCPCRFHKDKLKELRPLVSVACENYQPLGISKEVPRLTRYALLFYFDCWKKKPEFLISQNCKESLIKLRKFCVKRADSKAEKGNPDGSREN